MSEHTPEIRSTSGYAKKIEQLIEQRDSLRAVNAELLEALEAIYNRHNSETMSAARAAIASARKQGEQG
jgi:hypothetical protein